MVMVSQLGPALDVRTTFRHEGDLLIRVVVDGGNTGDNEVEMVRPLSRLRRPQVALSTATHAAASSYPAALAQASRRDDLTYDCDDGRRLDNGYPRHCRDS